MRRRRLVATAAGATLALAGCSSPGGDATPTSVEYEARALDTAGTERRVLAGGLAYDLDRTEPAYYATLLTDRDALGRFRFDLFEGGHPEFAALARETEFSRHVLLVFQAFPQSSVPDYRVTELVRDGDELRAAVTDEADAGTDDITLETLLVRARTTGVRSGVVRTAAGASVRTD